MLIKKKNFYLNKKYNKNKIWFLKIINNFNSDKVIYFYVKNLIINKNNKNSIK